MVSFLNSGGVPELVKLLKCELEGVSEFMTADAVAAWRFRRPKPARAPPPPPPPPPANADVRVDVNVFGKASAPPLDNLSLLLKPDAALVGRLVDVQVGGQGGARRDQTGKAHDPTSPTSRPTSPTSHPTPGGCSARSKITSKIYKIDYEQTDGSGVGDHTFDLNAPPSATPVHSMAQSRAISAPTLHSLRDNIGVNT